jgi:hypothetical protein
MNKIPTRRNKSSLFSLRFFALHVSGTTFTHPQEPQLYKQVWCNCISRFFVARRSVCQIQNSCTEGIRRGCRLYTCQTRIQATSPAYTFRTAVLDLTHTSPSYKKPTYTVTPYLLVQLRFLRIGECSARNM